MFLANISISGYAQSLNGRRKDNQAHCNLARHVVMQLLQPYFRMNIHTFLYNLHLAQLFVRKNPILLAKIKNHRPEVSRSFIIKIKFILSIFYLTM